jgi:thioredoxin-like negative regulator of GroEL
MLQVSSVPHTFSVKGGQIVEEFLGIVSDDKIQEFLTLASEAK